MTPGIFGRHLLRESRGARGRLAFFAACLAVGVAAVVTVAGLSRSLETGIRKEARRLLAADLIVEGSRAVPEAVETRLRSDATLEVAHLKEMATVVAATATHGGAKTSQLVELKAVAGEYPFYGQLETRPAGLLPGRLRAEEALAAPALLRQLGLKLGDEILIGGHPFVIAGEVIAEPDRIANAFSLGPRVMVSRTGLERTGLEQFGSRISRRILVRSAADPAALRALQADIRRLLGNSTGFRVESHAEALPSLREGVRRVERFLGLVALLSLLLGGLGVAQTTRAWLASRMDAIAILRCLGLRPREIVWLYLGQSALLGLVGSLVGILGGVLVGRLVPLVLEDLLPSTAVDLWQPAAWARGLGLGMGVALLFSLAPLAATRRVPPLRVLRRDVEPLPASRASLILTGTVLLCGVWAAATVQSGSVARGGLFTLGLGIVAAALAGAALGAVKLAARMPRELGQVWLRHGVASLARPGAATLGAIVALGLGVLLVLAMQLVDRGLAEELRSELPGDAPTVFLIDIQSDQWSGVQELLATYGATRVDSVPVVTARLAAIDDRGIKELVRGNGGDGDRRWALTREQRLTYMSELPADNRIVSGVLWGDPEAQELSVEADFAADLGLTLGSRVRFDVQGVPLELTVTSLRTVDWRTFGINFFFVVEPGVLEAAPQHRLAAIRLPGSQEEAFQTRLATSFPNVTMFKIREILATVAKVIGRLASGVELLGGFTVVSGIIILAGAVSAGAVRRGREVALLKTLGMTRRGVVAVFATEYLLVGLVAGIIGSLAGNALAWAVITQGMDLSWSFRPGTSLAAIVAAAAITASAGVAASWGALRRRPLEVLREA